MPEAGGYYPYVEVRRGGEALTGACLGGKSLVGLSNGGRRCQGSTKKMTFSLSPEMAERVSARGSVGNGSGGGGTNAVT